MFQLIFPFSVFAESNKITNIEKGSLAPFPGVLMSEDLATKLYLDAKFSPKECDIRIEEKLGVEKLNCERGLDILNSKLLIQAEKYEFIIEFKNNRVNFLEKRWSPRPWYESGEFWYAAGVISGVLLTVATGYALGQIDK